VKIRVPLLRELTMLALGSAGVARELFWVPTASFSLLRFGICLALMLGPAAVTLWLRGRTPDMNDSDTPLRSSESRSPSQP
jgi:hypothetical protein